MATISLSSHATPSAESHRFSPSEQPQGKKDYTKLATTMDKYDSLAIFHRFGDLNMLNLLARQAELLDLRTELFELLGETYRTELFEEPGIKNFNLLIQSAYVREDDNNLTQQWELLLKIRHLLHEYNKALLQVSQIQNLDTPSQEDVTFLRNWLFDPRMGSHFLRGEEAQTWNPKHNYDFITFKTRSNSSAISGLKRMTGMRIDWLCRTTKQSADVEQAIPESIRLSKSQIEKRDANTSRLIMGLFGGTALIAPTIIMSLHQSLNTSLITLSVATILFAIILAIGARDSSGKDVLSATAAYAAVLVVFVGTSLTIPPST